MRAFTPSNDCFSHQSARQALDNNNNEVVFLVTTYDSFDRIKESLTQAGISVNNETKEGNLTIRDAVEAYQIDSMEQPSL